jgi:heme/copper-type cytochrome/quinol oxidase subunit 4
MINLLPTKEKIKRKQEKDLKLFLIVGFLIMSILAVVVLSFLSIKFYINNQVTYLKILINNKEQDISYTKTLDKKLSEINNILYKFNDFYKEQFALSIFLTEISAWLIADISFDTFFYQEENSEIAISCSSKELETVYSFREVLKNQKKINNLSFSLDNWLETEEINFRATFNIEE